MEYAERTSIVGRSHIITMVKHHVSQRGPVVSDFITRVTVDGETVYEKQGKVPFDKFIEYAQKALWSWLSRRKWDPNEPGVVEPDTYKTKTRGHSSRS